ncbi:MAG: sodium:alanine symporter [Alteromonadaceae bacterium]|jgi:AGCS family alanine or glycine:cation symporter|uniref:Alanine/glycine:cation symporter family protein n=2 Tax=Rheinheimera aquimaris TaxID=412437 RepID=A0ABN1DGM7_9GAMM|nr:MULTISPECIES: alanine/glycine:cation symporter family protein [Rheinheimera]MBJ91803.1 sodium:alanine symporter [Alteromonadaceae bacterium]MCB5212068.1 alanine:cation symporter family protein [Rheinheimera aquimaris]MCD1599467.1 alanine:cation symporter family protein [Rheinheimera aquimaris]HBN87615.1 sodium:alanine symporter [Rheinheimera sp.]|tara:strand:- start:870 stop:2387 length:1518 start_codon:yes stop_codon:yes gene_type:complete
MEGFISALNGIIWSPALIYLCLGAGLFYSILTRFAQVRHFKEMCKLLLNNNESDKGISSFQALAVSLSGRVGVGNIAGVAAAIGFGGPGAIFWMWVVAFLGASTAYAESTLGQIYKVEENGQYRGGPAYYFERCLGWRWLGVVFAISAIIGCGIFLPGVQANAVGNAVTQIFGDGNMVVTSFGEVGTYKLIALAIILIVLAFIIFGGIKRIAHFTQIVVPFMALGYIVMALIVVFLNLDKVPGVFNLIFSDAFSAQAGFGAAIGWGVKRGIYSNEAGQGTGPHAAAAAEVEHPSQQGLVQAFSVYVDTLFVCTATALMILITQQYNVAGELPAGQFIVQNVDAATEIGSAAFTQMALLSVFGNFGQIFVGIALFFFAFTTILAYYYITETNVAYLNRVFNNKLPVVLFKLLLMFMVAYGTVNSAGYIWNIGDIGVGLMAWVNVVGILAIFFMYKPTMRCLRDYEEQKKNGGPISFDPVRLGIKNATFWENKLAKQQAELQQKDKQ